MLHFRFFALAVLCISMLLGCSKAAPDCNDIKTKQKVLEKVAVIPVALPAFIGTKHRDPNIAVDDFLKNNMKSTYSDNGVSVSVMGPKGPLDISFQMKDIRTINFNKDIGKYECACNIVREMGGAKEPQPVSVNYTSELADKNSHYVSVTMVDPLNPADKRTLPDLDLKAMLEKIKSEDKSQ